MDAVDVWEAERDEDLTELAKALRDRTREPSFRAFVLSSTGDTLGLQVVGAELPDSEAKVLYVAGHGAFELVRVERWPPAPGENKPRVLLKLRAQPAATAK
jgi:hypothetical protein